VTGSTDGDEPVGEIRPEPPQFDHAPASVLTPMGQVDSIGAFARGLGRRRVQIALGVGGALVLLLALLAALV
jgi:hypothetical protein